jgi:RNA polymerase sigma-70 factor (ECF subfamily)
MDASGQFPETLWSLVILAGSGATERSSQALEKLCSVYWYPVYAFIRRKGYDIEPARDLTQGFFALLVEKNYISSADHQRGRFRTFLRMAVQRFLLNEIDHEQALRRGGGAVVLSIDAESAEGRYRAEPSHALTPESVYERRWALTVLERALRRTQERDESGRFAALAPFLTGDAPRGSYESAAATLKISEGAFKTAVHRMRQQYRESLRAEIAATVRDEAEIDGEIRYLMDVLARPSQGM